MKIRDRLWNWGSQFLPRAEEYLNRLFALAGDKPVMAGVYLWDWFAPSPPPMDGARLEEQLRLYFPLLETGKLWGLVVSPAPREMPKMRQISF